MFFMISFILSWIAWIFLADKSRWRELFPVCLLASFLGLTTDTLMNYYQLWGYSGSEHPLLGTFADDLGIYIVVTYLFIQWLPQQRTPRNMLAYWLIWTVFAILIEHFYLVTGHTYYRQWWNPWYSYLADWFLFWLFYKFHKTFQFSRLSKK